MTVYRIKDWTKHFENNKSKERDRCSYVCMPNKQDGMGLQRILGAPNGAAMFGLWCLILQKASRQRRPRNGWLTDDGDPDSSPWSLADLAFQWRQDLELLEAALDLFCHPRVGWLERLPSAYSSPAQKVGGHSAGTFDTQSARPGAQSARPEVESARLEAESAQERKKEGKKEGRNAPQPASDGQTETSGADPGDPQPLTDRELIRPLTPYVRWRTSDRDAEADNIAELVGLVRQHGPQVIMAAAETGHRATGGKIWPNQVAEHLPRPAAPESPDGPVRSPHHDRLLVEALAIAGRIGLDEVVRRLGFVPGRVTTDRQLAHVLGGNAGACEELIESDRQTRTAP